MDSGGQSGDECRTGEDDLPSLQDIPAVRPPNMNALVTGATGFVGGHLVEALQSCSVEVTALARSATKAADLVRRGVRVVSGDLDQQAGLNEAVRGQDVIYHVAGVVAARNETDFFHCNRDGTRNLLAAAERQDNTRFVLVS